MNVSRGWGAGEGPTGDSPGGWIMGPTAVLDLPDVPTGGCDEGVEFAFLDKEPGEREAAEGSGIPAAGGAAR